MNSRRWIITIIACLLVFAALAGYKTLQIKKAIEFGESFPEPSETVEVTTVKVTEVREQINTIGEVVAPQSIELRNELAGRISSVKFEAGEKVERGQVLLEIDSREEQAQLKAAKARAELALIDLKRIEKLIAKKTVSEEQLDQAKAKHDIATAEIEALQSVIDKKTLRAPFDAEAGIHQLEAGELIQANTLITQLIGINDFIWVDFQMPVEHTGIKLGTNVSISLPGLTTKQISGQIIAKDPALSPNSRNQKYRAKLSAELALPANTIVNVSVNSTYSKRLPQVPLTAYRNDQMGAFVYILVPAEKEHTFRAKRQSVTIGKKDDDMISVISGLSGGELIATHGAFKLRENVLVYVKQRSPKSDNAGQGE